MVFKLIFRSPTIVSGSWKWKCQRKGLIFFLVGVDVLLGRAVGESNRQLYWNIEMISSIQTKKTNHKSITLWIHTSIRVDNFFSHILSYFCFFVAAFKPCQGRLNKETNQSFWWSQVIMWLNPYHQVKTSKPSRLFKSYKPRQDIPSS